MKTFKQYVAEIAKPTGKLKNACWKGYTAIGTKNKNGREVPNCVPIKEEELDEVAAWQRKEGKNPEGGLNKKGIASYRRENPGSKLSMAVTTPPSKLDPDSKPAKRRKSFCARMGGMPGPMKDEKGRPTRKALSLRKWNC
jgi:putative hemolysin